MAKVVQLVHNGELAEFCRSQTRRRRSARHRLEQPSRQGSEVVSKRVSKKWGHANRFNISPVMALYIHASWSPATPRSPCSASAPSQPGKSAFHHPTRKNHEGVSAVPTPAPITDVPGLASIGSIRPELLEPGKPTLQTLKHQLCPIPVLHISRMHCNTQHQTHGVDDDVTLAACHLLTRIIAARPPFSVVLTLAILRSDSLSIGYAWTLSQTEVMKHRS